MECGNPTPLPRRYATELAAFTDDEDDHDADDGLSSSAVTLLAVTPLAVTPLAVTGIVAGILEPKAEEGSEARRIAEVDTGRTW